MCPADQSDAKPDDATDAPGAEAAKEPNHVVGPLTDDELRAGGMKRAVAYIRTERSKEALRKEKQRNKQKSEGKREINLSVPDDDRSRATMRGAAIAIEDEMAHRAFELLLADEGFRHLRDRSDRDASFNVGKNNGFVFRVVDRVVMRAGAPAAAFVIHHPDLRVADAAGRRYRTVA